MAIRTVEEGSDAFAYSYSRALGQEPIANREITIRGTVDGYASLHRGSAGEMYAVLTIRTGRNRRSPRSLQMVVFPSDVITHAQSLKPGQKVGIVGEAYPLHPDKRGVNKGQSGQKIELHAVSVQTTQRTKPLRLR